MKTLILVFLALSCFRFDALANDTGQVALSAQVSTQLLQLTDRSYEPIYGQEPYETTCSRQVLDHVVNVCETVTDSVCHGGGEVCETQNDSVCNSSGCVSVPRRVCHTTPRVCENVPRRVCNDRSIYRTDYYSCTQYRTVVVGQRLVKTFNHQIEVVVANPAILGDAAIQVAINASQSSVQADLLGSFAAGLLSYEVVGLSAVDSGDVLNSSERVIIDLALTADKIKKMESAAISSLELGSSAIRMNITGAAGLENNLNLGIKIVRRPSLWFASTLLDTEVDSKSLSLVSEGNDIKALIPLQKLGLEKLNNVRYDLVVSVNLKRGRALNANDFGVAFSKRLDQSLSKVKPSF